MNWKEYRKSKTTEMVPYSEWQGELPDHVSISDADRKKGAPRPNDMIARNPEDPDDMWLVSKEYFQDNYERDD